MNPSDYKSIVASRYISVDPSQIGLKIIESDYYLCSHKLDGHLGILSIENGIIKLFNRSGDELHIPSIVKAAKTIKTDAVFAGEICVFKNGKPGTNADVTTAIAEPDAHDIRFGLFDLISDNELSSSNDLKHKFERIKEIAGNNETIFAIDQHAFESRKDIIQFFSQAILEHEGIVVRSSNGITYKVKPIRTIDLSIIGFAEGIGARKGMIRDLMLGCVTQDNEFLVVAHCGNGFTDDQRKELFETLSPLAVDSNYLEVSGAKTAFIMVKPELVAELSCLDMIGETGSGLIKKTLLNYDSSKGYERKGLASTVSLISPVFIRLRSDKKTVTADVGLRQIEEFLSQPDDAVEISWKASEVVGRDIYTKSSKGSTAIRKFIILKTNKEHTGEYSPFAVVYTDFSAGRKSPLEQEIYLCQTENEATQKVADLKEENIKKGWAPFNQ
jgi:ATP-dependent DNA ligase